MAGDRIRLTVPDVRFEEVEPGLREVVESGWLVNGPRVAALEVAVASRVGTRYAVATSSGTTALHLALTAVGVEPGDEVIVPDFTFPAPANAVIHCGGRPVPTDVEEETFNLDPRRLDDRLSGRTRAVVAVHQFGHPADMTAIRGWAARHGIAVIEDAACALGATLDGRPCGSLARIACFSFHPRKVVTTGEGGLITTDEPELAATSRLWRNHGMTADGEPRFVAPGFNFRMAELPAVLGLAQIRRLDEMILRRRRAARRLTGGLRGLPWLRPPVERASALHTYQSYVVLLDEGVDRARLVGHLRAAGIEATRGAPALHEQPYVRERYGPSDDLPVAAAAARRSLALPMHARLTADEVDRIIDVVHGFRA